MELMEAVKNEEHRLLAKFGCSCYNKNYCSEVCRLFENQDPTWIQPIKEEWS